MSSVSLRDKLASYAIHQRWRKPLAAVLIVISLILVGDLVRIVFFPPGRVETTHHNESTITLEVDRTFVWSSNDCFNVRWQTDNLRDVSINGTPVASTGRDTICITPPQQISLGYISTWNSIYIRGTIPSLEIYYLALQMPVYMLRHDILWLWRVVLIFACTLTSAVLLNRQLEKHILSFLRPPYPPVTRILFVVWSLGFLVAVLVINRQILLYIGTLQVFIKSFNPAALNPGLAHVLNVLWLVPYSVLQMLLGMVVLKIIFHKKLATDNAALILPTAFLIGMGLSALVYMLLALIGELTLFWVLTGMLVTLIVGGIFAGSTTWQLIQESAKGIADVFRSTSVTERFLGWSIFPLCIIPMMRTFGVMNYDGLVTYMLQARMFALTGDMVPLRDDSIFHFQASGMIGELNMALLYLLGGEAAAKLHSHFILLAIAALSVALVQQLNGNRRIQLIMLFAVVTSPVLFSMVAGGKTDIYALGPSLAAVVWTLRLHGSKAIRVAVTIGILSGILTLAKVTYAPTTGLMILLISVGIYLYYRQPARQLLINWVVIGGVALVIVLFQPLRMMTVFNEPFAPWFYVDSQANMIETYDVDGDWIPEQVKRTYRIAYPFIIPLQIYVMTHGGFTPLWIVLIPFGIRYLFGTQRDYRVVLATLAALVTLVVWLSSVYAVVQFRYIASLILILFLPGIFAMEQDFHKRLLAPLLRFTIGAVFLYAAVNAFVLSTLHGLVGIVEPSQTHLTVLNDVAEPGARLFSNSEFDYHLRDDLLLCSSSLQDRIVLRSMSQPERWAYLYEQGFNYISLEERQELWFDITFAQFFKRLVPLNTALAPDYLTVERIHQDEKAVIYRLQGTESAPARRASCQQTEGSGWAVVNELS